MGSYHVAFELTGSNQDTARTLQSNGQAYTLAVRAIN